jgi:hypothetical protein
MLSVTELADDAVVEWVDCYGSGVLWVALRDSQGRRTHVCVDGRDGSPTVDRLFTRGRHPNKVSAVLADRGGADEARLIAILRRELAAATDDDPTKPYWLARVVGEMLVLPHSW